MWWTLILFSTEKHYWFVCTTTLSFSLGNTTYYVAAVLAFQCTVDTSSRDDIIFDIPCYGNFSSSTPCTYRCDTVTQFFPEYLGSISGCTPEKNYCNFGLQSAGGTDTQTVTLDGSSIKKYAQRIYLAKPYQIGSVIANMKSAGSSNAFTVVASILKNCSSSTSSTPLSDTTLPATATEMSPRSLPVAVCFISELKLWDV